MLGKIVTLSFYILSLSQTQGWTKSNINKIVNELFNFSLSFNP